MQTSDILESHEFDIFLHRGSDDTNSRYLVDYQASDSFYVIVSEDVRELFISEVEYSKAESESDADGVQSFSEYSEKDVREDISGQADILADYLNEEGFDGAIGVGPEFPSLLTKSLEGAGFEVEVLEENPINKSRMVKTKEELENMRSIQKKTEGAMKEVKAVLKDSKIGEDSLLYYDAEKLTTEKLREKIRDAIPSAEFPKPTIAASGKNTGDPHKRGEGPIEAHHPIIVDIVPKGKHGYVGDMTRTFVKGNVPEKIKRMHEASLEALENALQEVEAGVNAEKIHNTAFQTVESHGFSEDEGHKGYVHRTGHSLGLERHEPPSIAKDSIKLKKNMVVTVEPGIYYPDEGGVRTEDMIRVTENGYENFNSMDSSLINVE